jgi:hypothetical protein
MGSTMRFFASTFIFALPLLHQASATLPPKGGWALQLPVLSSCPAGTATCFSNQTSYPTSTFPRTGVTGTFSRGQECCPSQGWEGEDEGTTLGCGTYVNVGQPFACCPVGRCI